jgi:hypothetical protein
MVMLTALVGFGFKLSEEDKDAFVGGMECALHELGVNIYILKDIKLTAWMFRFLAYEEVTVW